MKNLLVAMMLLLPLPVPPGVYGEIGVDRFGEVLKALAQCQEAYYRLEDYRGTLVHEVREANGTEREERIEVTFRKPGFLSLQWQSGLYKGTTLLVRPGWNQGNLLLRLGEWFDYATISMAATDLGEPFVPALRDLSEWLTALVALAQRPVTDRSLQMLMVYTVAPNLPEGKILLSVPAFLIPFRDNAVATFEFAIERGTGIPSELVLRGVGGEIRQRLTYTDLQVNVGLPTRLFTWEHEDEELLPVQNGTTIDLRGFAQHWQHRYGEISDYTGTWKAEVWREGGSQRAQATFKFRKPFDLYLQWDRVGSGIQEVLFRQGWNDNRVRIRTSLWGVPLIGDIDPEGKPVQWGGRSLVAEFGIHRLVERLQEQLLRGWLRGELHTQFLGVQSHDNRPCYVLAFDFPAGPGRDYASARIVTTWDVAERLLVKYETFQAHGGGYERQEFYGTQLNVALPDRDFDAANPTYGFLLFRYAPWIDRFLTGRD
jgi:outer membrane lipoprotein-sorting protein